MKNIESEQPKGRIGLQGSLTFYINTGEYGYKAVCPELDIACGGETLKGATEDLFLLAKAEVRGILLGKGDLPSEPDERRLLAEFLKEVKDISSVFEEIPVPAPMSDGK